MELVTLKLLTVVAEAVLHDRLLREMRELGARGYTLTEAFGEGTRGVHASDWEGKNLRIETLVPEGVAERILQHLHAEYFEHYAVIAYLQDVQVIRGTKYQ